MKNKLVKSMTMIIAIAMLVSMVPAVVSADALTTIETVSVEIGAVNETTGSAQVTVIASGITGDMTDYTLLAIRGEDEVLVSELPSMDDGDLENWIEYIDQDDATISDNTLTASFTLRGANLDEMKTRTNSYGDVITVLLGGTGVEAKGGSDTYELPKTAAPAVSADKTAIYADEAIEITVTSPATGYMAAAKVKVDGEEIATTYEENVITIAANTLEASENAQAITVECEGYKPTTAINVTVKAVEARFTDTTPKGLTVSEYDPEHADEPAVVTVPESYPDSKTGVTVAYVSYSVDGSEATDLEGTTFEVVRNEENGAAKEVVVNVKLTYNGSEDTSKTVTTTVTAKGVVGPRFTADNVEVIGTNVYRQPGKSVVIVKHEEVDAGNTSIVVDGVKLYYFPVRGTHVGVINTTTVDALISGNKISTVVGTPVALYSGVALEKTLNPTVPTLDDYLVVARFGIGLTAVPEGTELNLLGATDAQYDSTAWMLAGDVVGEAIEDGRMDGKLDLNDGMTIARIGIGLDNREFVIDKE